MIILIVTIILALLVTTFAIQNAEPIAINLFWTTTDVPLFLVIIGSVLAGAIIMLLIFVWRKFSFKK